MLRPVCPCGSYSVVLRAKNESTAIWCANCGNELSYEDLNIPIDLQLKIINWNDLWLSSSKQERTTILKEQGTQLASLISRYYSCMLSK